MSIVNTEKILLGTDQKEFNQAHTLMLEQFTEETAENFFNSYKNKSLLFILKNALEIMKEPYFGSAFFMDLINSGFIPFHKVEDIRNLADGLVEESQTRNLAWDQKSKYESMSIALNNICKDFEHTISVFNMACKSKESKEYIETFYDYLYEINTDGTEDEFNNVIFSLYDCKCPYSAFSLYAFIILKYGDVSHLYSNIEDFILARPRPEDEEDKKIIPFDEKKASFEAKKIICELSKDEKIVESIRRMNMNIKFLWLGVVSDGCEKPELKKESTSDLPIFSAIDFMERTIEDTESSFMMEKENCNKFDYLCDLRSYYEAMRDFTIQESYVNGNDCMESVIFYEDCIDEISGEISMMEWTNDGEPDSVIKKHIMTRREVEAEQARIAAEKNKAKQEALSKVNDKPEDNSEDSDEEDEDIVDEDNLADRKKVVELVYTACKKIPDTREHVTKAEETKFLEGESNSLCLGSFGKKIKDVIKNIKNDISDYSEDFSVSEDNYFTIFLNVKKNSDYYYSEAVKTNDDETMEQDGEDDTTKPEAPKEDVVTKIQNKAIDHDAKRMQKKGIRKEKITKLKNAGKAVSAGPKDTGKTTKGFVDKFNEMDIKRRKEFFLKPGYRHKIFRNLKHALMYGVAANVKLAYIPLAMLIRHFSKDKDRRIRNELTRELDTEIKICEEKINDANSNGDQKEKYKLMRIKEKLVAEKNRVQLNSNYI